MTPVTASRGEDGKINISFHNWMVPVLLAGATLVLNFVASSYAQKTQASNIELRVTRVEAQTEHKVDKEEYKQAVQFLNEKTDRIDRNVQILLDHQLEQRR